MMCAKRWFFSIDGVWFVCNPLKVILVTILRNMQLSLGQFSLFLHLQRRLLRISVQSQMRTQYVWWFFFRSLMFSLFFKLHFRTSIVNLFVFLSICSFALHPKAFSFFYSFVFLFLSFWRCFWICTRVAKAIAFFFDLKDSSCSFFGFQAFFFYNSDCLDFDVSFSFSFIFQFRILCCISWSFISCLIFHMSQIVWNFFFITPKNFFKLNVEHLLFFW